MAGSAEAGRGRDDPALDGPAGAGEGGEEPLELSLRDPPQALIGHCTGLVWIAVEVVDEIVEIDMHEHPSGWQVVEQPERVRATTIAARPAAAAGRLLADRGECQIGNKRVAADCAHERIEGVRAPRHIVQMADMDPARALAQSGGEAADADGAAGEGTMPVLRLGGIEAVAGGRVEDAILPPLEQSRHHVGVVVEMEEDEILRERPGLQRPCDEQAAPAVLEAEVAPGFGAMERGDLVRSDARPMAREDGGEIGIVTVIGGVGPGEAEGRYFLVEHEAGALGDAGEGVHGRLAPMPGEKARLQRYRAEHRHTFNRRACPATVAAMAELYLLADRHTRAALVAAVGRRLDLAAEALTALEDVAAVIAAARREDVIVIAGSERDAWLGELLAHDLHNLYDGERMIAEDEPAARLAAMSRRGFLGPVRPDHLDPGTIEARRFRPRPLRAGAVPRHLLFVVNSMPKSGTLWMAAMLEAVLGVETGKQLVISHVADLEVDWERPNVQAAVTLVRDLRDVVVSWCHHAARTDLSLGHRRARYPTVESFYWEFFLPTLMSSERYYGGDLVRWLHRSAASYVPRLRYEDMLSDPQGALEKVLNAWMVDYDAAAVAAVVRASGFAALAVADHRGDGYLARQFRGGHLRRGVAGAWRDELPAEVQADIAARFADYQHLLGYAGT